MSNKSKQSMIPPIVSWKPKKHEMFVESDGGLFICNFKKVVDSDGVEPFTRFMLNKTAYEKQLGQITHYINYFINKYDSEHELMTSYLHIKYIIEKEKAFAIPINATKTETMLIVKDFVAYVYDEIFGNTTHMRDNIMQLVTDNYFDNVEKQREKKPAKEYLESLEFTNEHVKIMLAISFGMKIIAPIAFHYLYINMVKLEKDSMYIYQFYKPLFTLFSDTVNIFNKLYVYVKSRVSDSYSLNSTMYADREIFGVDVFGIINSFTKKVIISDNMMKYSFPSNWDATLGKYVENIPGLAN